VKTAKLPINSGHPKEGERPLNHDSKIINSKELRIVILADSMGGSNGYQKEDYTVSTNFVPNASNNP
jgi:hypothetical protein